MLLKTQQPVLLLLGEAADRDARLPGHHLGDRLGVHPQALALVDLVLAAGLRDPLLQLRDPVPQLGRLLVLLVGDRLVLVAGQLLDLALHRPYVRALGPRPQPHPGAGLVDEVDGLVRQPAVAQIPVGQLHGRHQRLVGVADLVVRLVPVAQTAQDLDRVRGGGLRHQDRLEAAGQRGVLLDPAVLLQGGRPDDVQFAAGEGRLEDVARIHRAALASAPGADDGVQFVDEDDQLFGVGADLLDDVVHPLLEVAPVAGPGDDRRQVQGDHAPPEEDVGHVALGDALGEPLHDRGLADARVADQHGVVLAAPGEHLDGLLDLLVAPDHRVDPPLPGQGGEVTAVLVQRRGARRGPRALRARWGGLRRLRLAGGGVPGGVQDVPGGRVGVGGQGAEHMLGADVAGAARAGHLVGVEQGALDGGGQGQRGRRRGLARAVLHRARPVVDLGRQRVGVRARPAEQAPGRLGGEGGAQQVLGVQVTAAVLGGVLGGAAHQLPGGLAQKPADVDLAGALSAEEAGEEFCERVTLRADETIRHRHPFLRWVDVPGPGNPAGARSCPR